MSLTTKQATYQLRAFRRWRVNQVSEIAWEGEPDGISGDLVLALYSRETGITNVIGGGYFTDPDDRSSWVTTGTDRGLGQLNEEYHDDWLRSTPGCPSGEYRRTYDSALPKGRVPAGVLAQTRKVIEILRSNIRQARAAGAVEEADAVRVALAGYNGGIARAITAWKRGEDPDVVTTGGDYGADVLARRATFRRARKAMGWT